MLLVLYAHIVQRGIVEKPYAQPIYGDARMQQLRQLPLSRVCQLTLHTFGVEGKQEHEIDGHDGGYHSAQYVGGAFDGAMS